MLADSTPTRDVVALAARTIGRDERVAAPFGEALVEEHWLCTAGELRLAMGEANRETWMAIALPGRLRIALHSVLVQPVSLCLDAVAAAATPAASVGGSVVPSPQPRAARAAQAAQAAEAVRASPQFTKLCAALLAAPSVELAASEGYLRSKLPAELDAEATSRASTPHAIALQAWHEAWKA